MPSHITEECVLPDPLQVVPAVVEAQFVARPNVPSAPELQVPNTERVPGDVPKPTWDCGLTPWAPSKTAALAALFANV